MKRISKSAFFYALFILVIGANISFEVMAQNKTVASKKSNIKILTKEPILKLDLNGSRFQLGKPIELTMTIKNESDSTIFLFDVSPERSFDIMVKDASGSSLPLTAEGRSRVYPNIIMGRETISIDSGKELKLRKKVRLDELFNLKRASNYTLEVKRTYYFQNAGGKNEEKVLTSVEKFVIR